MTCLCCGIELPEHSAISYCDPCNEDRCPEFYESVGLIGKDEEE